jgi:tetratricopeptide (TPR) repeat protein
MRSRLETATRILAPLVAVAGAAAWFHGVVSGGDTWWHLASGREIVAHGSLVQLDSFSHTFAGRVWQNHEWLWDVVAWALYSFDPELLAWSNQLVMLLTFGLVFGVARGSSGRVLAAGAALWLAAATAHPFLDIRPQTAALGYLALFLATRRRSWAPWLWAPLVVLWVNSHASFLFGVGAIGLHVLFRIAEASREAGRLRLPGPECAGLAAALACVLANPYGLGLLAHPLSYLDPASPYRGIAEWSATGLALDPATFEGRFWILTGVGLLGSLSARRSDPYGVALFVVALVMAASARRFIPLFCVCAAPVAALAFADLQGVVTRRWPELDSARAGAIALLAAALASAWLWSGVRPWPRLFYRSTASFDYSHGSARFLDRFGRPVRLFNDFGMGGWLLFASKHGRVFIDGRSNTLYDDEILRDYHTILGREPGFEQLLARFGIEAVVVAPGDALVETLQQLPQPWHVGYRDFVSAVVLSPELAADAAALPTPTEPDEPNPPLTLERARVALARGDALAASDLARAALRLDPLFLHAYRVLARAQAALGDADGIERTIASGLLRFPRMRGRLYQYEAEAWLRLGDRERARRAYDRALRSSPLRHAELELQKHTALGAELPAQSP